MIRIVIADDHAVVRTGLQFIFDATPDLMLAAECRNGFELLEKLKNPGFDLVILDVSMPETDAFEILEHIKKMHPHLPVIIFTMNSDRNLAIRMFKKGADAFINKESSPELLMQAIRTVAQKRKFQTPEQMELVMGYLSNPATQANPHDSLTDREFQILCMLASGMRKTEIAETLAISKNTVNNHRNNIMKKMDFETTADLTRYAVTNRLIG